MKKRKRIIGKHKNNIDSLFDEASHDKTDLREDNIDYSNDIFSEEDSESTIKENENTIKNDNNQNFVEDTNDEEGFIFEDESPVTLKEALQFKITKKTIGIFIGIILSAFILGFGLYKIFPGGKVFNGIVKLDDTISNNKVECVVEDIVVTDNLSTSLKADEGKVFVCIYYKYKNISNAELKWEDLPYLSLGVYNTDETGKAPVKTFDNSSIDNDALREYSYIMGLDLRGNLDPLEVSESRYDVDVFEIDRSLFTTDKIYLTFDIFDKAIKVEEGLSTLPDLNETIKENQDEIKKEQEEMGIQEIEDNSSEMNNQ